MSKVLIAGAMALTFTLVAPAMAQTADSAAAQAQIDDLKVQLRLLENQVDAMKAKSDSSRRRSPSKWTTAAPRSEASRSWTSGTSRTSKMAWM